MLTSSSDLPKDSLQIKQDDKFFNRLLSKESSRANPSCRVYYGVAPGAIPFMWESQPGTPKNNIYTSSIPPLTPPPSYLYSPQKNPTKKHSKHNLLNFIFPRLTLRKPHVSPSSSSSSYSSLGSLLSVSSISSQSGSSNIHGHNHFVSPGSSFSSKGDDDCPAIGSPTSPLCFGVGRPSAGGLRVIMKNALMSIVGHRSSQGTA